jgi:hypothetical protein
MLDHDVVKMQRRQFRKLWRKSTCSVFMLIVRLSMLPQPPQPQPPPGRCNILLSYLPLNGPGRVAGGIAYSKVWLYYSVLPFQKCYIAQKIVSQFGNPFKNDEEKKEGEAAQSGDLAAGNFDCFIFLLSSAAAAISFRTSSSPRLLFSPGAVNQDYSTMHPRRRGVLMIHPDTIR